MQYTHTCAICGKTFPRRHKPKETKSTYCSRSCANKAHSLRMQGENNSNFKNAKVTRNCKVCGKEVISYASFGNKKFYCSKECRNKGISIKLTGLQVGEKNPMFGKFGKLNPAYVNGQYKRKHPREFSNELKETVRIRDERKCDICKLQEREYRHPVHHIDYDKSNNCLENLITLCSSCHAGTNLNRDYWQKYFQEKARVKVNLRSK